jgi:protein dithiol oxidoreductase (disulfide-forming)
MTISKSHTFKNTLFAAFAAFALSGISNLANAAENYVAGKDYRVITNKGKVEKPNQIEVREFFWYGCSHCFNFEPFLTQWLKTKPADVNFVRTPAALNPVWEQNARGYYSIDLLGKQTQAIHSALFNSIHHPLKPKQLFDQASLAGFYSSQGVDADKFNGLYNSFAVSGKVAESKKLAMQYQIDGVPAMIVNGKYVVSGESDKSVKIVNFLIDKERKAMKK